MSQEDVLFEIRQSLLALRSREDRVIDAISKLHQADVDHELKDTERHGEVIGHIKNISMRVGKLETETDVLETTSRTELTKRAELWRGIVLKGLGAVALAIISAAIGYFVKR